MDKDQQMPLVGEPISDDTTLAQLDAELERWGGLTLSVARRPNRSGRFAMVYLPGDELRHLGSAYGETRAEAIRGAIEDWKRQVATEIINRNT